MDLDTYLAAHHLIVDAPTLTALGHTRAFARARVESGRWQVVHPSVYCAHTGPLSFESRCEAALRHVGRGAALDGATAAQLHGLAGYERAGIEIVVPHERRVRQRPDLVVRRCRTWNGAPTRIRCGLPVVDVERAVLIATTRAPGALPATVQQGLTTPDRLAARLDELGRFRGRAAVAAAVTEAVGGSRSWLEAAFRRLVAEAGLPPPVQQHPVDAGGRRVTLDACYPAERVAIELDGRAYHLAATDWAADLRRQNAVVLAGWTLLRFTASDLRDCPGAVVAAVRRALAARTAS